ncbi:MAG: DnaJ domain-containing protein [Halopseudomonas sp.]
MSILIVALTFIVLIVGIRWFLRRAPQRGKHFLLQLLLVMLALLGLWLALTGRLHWLFALFSSLLPFGRRLLPLLLPLLRWLPQLKRSRQRSRTKHSKTDQQSQVSTRWLAMTLDHDSGAITGQIIDGPFTGRYLNELSDAELVRLYQDCLKHDPEGVKLLDSYITRHRPELQTSGDQQSSEGQQRVDNPTDISTDEAYRILGLEPGASAEEITQAHKRMMQKMHPDRGGSNYLAAKINQAKQRLLG